METVTVYRVEHRDLGHGPYLDTEADVFYGVEGLHPAHEASRSHPGPGTDKCVGRYITMAHSFGFDSREKLDRWFKGFKHALHVSNFVIRVYEAPAVSTHISPRQAIFLKKKSKLVATLPVDRRVTKSA